MSSRGRYADFPKLSLRSFRACLACRRIQTEKEFSERGCENCGPDTKLSMTTPTFYGMLSMMNPGESWVAQWQSQRHLLPGLYAVAVSGSAEAKSTTGEGYEDGEEVDIDEDGMDDFIDNE